MILVGLLFCVKWWEKTSHQALSNKKKIQDKRNNIWNREVCRKDNDKLNRVMFDLFCHIFFVIEKTKRRWICIKYEGGMKNMKMNFNMTIYSFLFLWEFIEVGLNCIWIQIGREINKIFKAVLCLGIKQRIRSSGHFWNLSNWSRPSYPDEMVFSSFIKFTKFDLIRLR